MPESRFDQWVAERYDALWPELFEPTVIEPTVAFLAQSGRDGAGARVRHRHWADRTSAEPARDSGARNRVIRAPWSASLRCSAPEAEVGVTVGDFASTAVTGEFTLVYLLRNTITNLTTQDQQVESFRNAAGHLQPGGVFVIENYVPSCNDSLRVRPGTSSWPPPHTWVLRSTTWRIRLRSRTITGFSTVNSNSSHRRTVTCGRLNWT